jgi:hypothetical protein
LTSTGASVSVSYRLARRDVFAATAAANRYTKLAAGFAAVAVVITVADFLIGDPVWPIPLLIGSGFATGAAPGLLGVWAWTRRPDLAQAEILLEADPAGVRLALPMSASASEWSAFRRLRETSESFILDFGTGMGTFVPKRALSPEQAASLRSLAEAAGVLEKGSSWRLPVIGLVVGLALLVPVLALFTGGYLRAG